MAEVNECEKLTGNRPVAWLAQRGLIDSRWHLVHATHTTTAEIEATAKYGANVVICPMTEANLGDGFTDVAHWLNAGVGMTIGFEATGFEVGARADCVVLDATCPALLGVPAGHTLDALIFAADTTGVAQVYVAGERLIDGGMHLQQAAIAQTFTQTMRDVWRV
jgi:formimidoylglutamate deiminase